MKRTLIQCYATSMAHGLLTKAEALADLDHGPTKGRLRELFVTEILTKYLTSQFGVGSGIIVNQKGDQSRETDIILYDRRILPPFIQQQRLGVFPVEAVIDTIEIKSTLTKKDIKAADVAAKMLKELASTGSIYSDKPSPPGTSVFGFRARGLSELQSPDSGRQWLSANMTTVRQICVPRMMSWLCLSKGWQYQAPNEYHEETKRYIAVFLDNVRTHAERNYQKLTQKHYDWIGLYIRDHPGNRQRLDSQP